MQKKKVLVFIRNRFIIFFTMDDKAKNILAYLLDFLHEKDYDCRTNVTYITKLLYMIELYHYRRTGERLTDLTWKFWYFGPYAEEIENVDRTEHGILLTFFKFNRDDLPSNPQNNIDPQTKGDIERVIEDFAHMPLPNLLDFVYFKTEPMQNVKTRGELLDFSTVKPKPKELSIDISTREINEIKGKIKEKAKSYIEKRKIIRHPPAIILSRPYKYDEDPVYNWNLDTIEGKEVSFEDS
ncbi:hypothetical protein DRQ33_04495 [bacterium]|nr:MAG: hypothetical protein DRQ33_04495 [bacterium]